jgi:hypothetical protein
MLTMLAGVLVIGRSGLAEPVKVWQLPPTPCSSASLSVTDRSVFVGMNTPDREHWQVLRCRAASTTEVVLKGEGRWGGLSVSPDGTQALVQLDQGECSRQVQWYDLSRGRPLLVGTYQGEVIRRYAWSKDSKRWLGLSSTSCGGARDELVVHSQGGKEARVKLPGSIFQRPAVEYWVSDDGFTIYTLLSDGGFYRDHKLLLRIPVGKNKCLRHHTSRMGSVVYALSGTNLYRVDAQQGTVMKKSLATLNPTLHLDVCDPRVLALGPGRVGLIAVGKPITSPQSMYVVSYPTLKLQRLTTLSKDETAACSATGEGLAAGQGRTWMLWVDPKKQRTILESRDAG